MGSEMAWLQARSEKRKQQEAKFAAMRAALVAKMEEQRRKQQETWVLPKSADEVELDLKGK